MLLSALLTLPLTGVFIFFLIIIIKCLRKIYNGIFIIFDTLNINSLFYKPIDRDLWFTILLHFICFSGLVLYIYIFHIEWGLCCSIDPNELCKHKEMDDRELEAARTRLIDWHNFLTDYMKKHPAAAGDDSPICEFPLSWRQGMILHELKCANVKSGNPFDARFSELRYFTRD